MKPTDYTVSPGELKILKQYIEDLRNNPNYRDEIKDKDSNAHVIDVARRVIAFFKKRREEGHTIIIGRTLIDMKYLSELASNDSVLKATLKGKDDFTDELIDEYSKMLEKTNRHHVLSKPLSELTGYDIKQIISYVIEDSKDDQ